MKKIFIYLLLTALVFTLMTGCKKKDETGEVSLEQNLGENQEEVIGTDNAEVENQEEASDEVEYVLYLRYKDKPFLYDELFSINMNDEKFKDKSIEEFVLEQLISYKEQGQLTSPVPEGTKLISVERENTKVIVNLSKEFTAKKMSKSDAKLAIGGIVNSIIALPGDETVQIIVEGKPLEDFNGVKTSEPLYFIEGLIPDK